MDKDFLLVRRMKSGDEAALESFVRKYYPVILRYCQYHLSDTGYAEDLTQETFEHFFRSLPGYQHYGKAGNYLYVIAGNLCRDFRRKKTELPILAVLWMILHSIKSSFFVQRSMGVLAPLFVIMLIPELWKNRSTGSMEIEETSYYSLRQIYAARMLLFAMADIFLLSIFFGAALGASRLTLWEIVVQFILPFNVTCGICFWLLGSRRLYPEYLAVILCLLWTAVWTNLILKEEIYQAISIPVWMGSITLSVLYLVSGVLRVYRKSGNSWEEDPSWS